MNPPAPRILLATDGSGAARHATRVAADLASAFTAELTIVHVVPALEYRVGRFAPTLPITRTLDDPYASSVLHDARRIAWNRGVAARTVLIAGEPPRAICALATRLQADLLVIADKPESKLWPMPSRIRRWLQTHAPCAVLAVPADRPPPGATEPLPQPASAQNALAQCCVCDGGRCACCGALRSPVPTAARSA